MPNVQAGDLSVYYETTGTGEPLVLIPYLAADQACYASRLASTRSISRASRSTCAAAAE